MAFAAITDFDNRLVRTVKEQIAAPGFMVARYVQGERIRYYNPIGYLLLSLAASVILKNIVISLGLDFEKDDEDSLRQFFNNYPFVEMLIVLPIISWLLKILITKSERNYAEHLVFITYTFATSILLYSILSFTGIKLLDNGTRILNFVTISYIAWAAINFNHVKPLYGFFRAWLAIICGILMYAVPYGLIAVYF
ncbi:MAG: DUF3667 domain-containing protein [Kangiellaceae bacterium]|nr:DUF3667 domain-containing protein [Kangiellaceae bacterium]